MKHLQFCYNMVQYNTILHTAQWCQWWHNNQALNSLISNNIFSFILCYSALYYLLKHCDDKYLHIMFLYLYPYHSQFIISSLKSRQLNYYSVLREAPSKRPPCRVRFSQYRTWLWAAQINFINMVGVLCFAVGLLTRGTGLAHWGQDKMAAILQMICNFLVRNLLCFDLIFIEICSEGSDGQIHHHWFR